MTTYRNGKFAILCLFFLSVLLIVKLSSCQKDFSGRSENFVDIEKFFKAPANADPAILRAIQSMKEKNLEHPYVVEFIKQHGYPVWDKAEVKVHSNTLREGQSSSAENPGDTLIVIPTVLSFEQFVESVLNIRMNGEVFFKLFDGDDYSKYGFNRNPERTEPNADDIAALFMRFERALFQTEIFHIRDSRLFGYWPAGTTKPATYYLKNAVNILSTGCIGCQFFYVGEVLPPDMWGQYDPSGLMLICDPSSTGSCPGGGGGAPYPTIYIPTNMPGTGGAGTGGWTPYPGGGYPGSGSGGNGNTGGSGGSTSTNSCARGWVGVRGSGSSCPPDPYNPYVGDSVIVTDDIKDSFPCVQRIIDSLSAYSNLNV
jgi:uncharacterized membrane protein YgcG